MSDIEKLDLLVHSLEASVRIHNESYKKLADELELTRTLTEQDRIQIARLIVLMNRLTESTGRLEETTHHVAEDLAARSSRADDAPTDIPGAAADAASGSGEFSE